MSAKPPKIPDFAALLKDWRERKGLTQQQAAEVTASLAVASDAQQAASAEVLMSIRPPLAGAPVTVKLRPSKVMALPAVKVLPVESVVLLVVSTTS